MQNNKQAFTLVELIVVITILAILGTIAFISLQGYSAQARDSKRVSDISNIKKSLELFSLNTGKYPKPDNYNTVSYTGELIWYQGIVGDQVSTNLSRNLNEKPIDPLTEEEYIYSTTNSQTEYEVLGLYENNMLSNLQLFEKINAANFSFAKVEGNYNGLYARTSSFYIPTPSIINGNVWGNVDFADDETLIESQVVTGGDNIPGESTGGLDITLSPYEGVITSNSTDEEKLELVEAIQTAYSGSVLANNTIYADVLSKTSTGEITDFVDVVVLKVAEFSTFASGEGGGSGGGGEEGGESNVTWQEIDGNCQIATDITVSGTDLSGDPITQVWAPCNSTLGGGIIYNSAGVGGGSCFDYRGNNLNDEEGCYGYSVLESSYNSTYGIDNIWGKLYIWYYSGATDEVNLDNNNDGIISQIENDEVCPNGRHIPSFDEWKILLKNLSCDDYGSAPTTTWLCEGLGWKSHNTKLDTNNLVNRLKVPLSGISGYGGSEFLFGNGQRANNAYFWSIDEDDNYNARGVRLYYIATGVSLRSWSKTYAHSVRCIRD